MSDAMPIAIVMLVMSIFSGICLVDAINARIKARDILMETSSDFTRLTNAVDKLHDICKMWSVKYDTLVDDYNDLLSAYTRAYGILEENGLLPTDEQDDQEEGL